MRLSNILRKPVVVTNTETGDTLEFSSMTEAGIYLGLSRVSVKNYFISPVSLFVNKTGCCDNFVALE